MQSSTICAVATAQGGAIGIVRVSGGQAHGFVQQIFRAKGGKLLSEQRSHSLVFGEIVEASGEVLDEVLVSLFRAPHSYTGEDAAEIACHGSSYILQRVLALLIDAGCRAAEPGEFTQRAFLNGKMDLSQAEAVADLIAASTQANHRIAMSQMRGDFSRKLEELRQQLLHLTALMELELDFSDHEDLEFADRSQLETLAAEIERICTQLADSFQMGNALRNGLPVAIVGSTNSGKSTLLNALLHDERAIVSDVHGTTRDVVEDTYNLNGTLFRFIDTAGLRNTTDKVEKIGIERSWKKMDEAQILLFVIDSSCAAEQLQRLANDVFEHAADKNILLIFNKSDLCGVDSAALLAPYRTQLPPQLHVLHLSAARGEGLDVLAATLTDIAQSQQPESNIVVSNARHYAALRAAIDDLRRVRQGLHSQLSGDFISQDLRECLHHLAEITGGAITTDEVLGTVFKNFCIGK